MKSKTGNGLWCLPFLHRSGNAPSKPPDGFDLEDDGGRMGLLIWCGHGTDRCIFGNDLNGEWQ